MNMPSFRGPRLGVLAGLSLLTVSALAQPAGGAQGGPGGGERRHHGPPPEAIAACAGKASGAACAFTGRENQKLTGTCFAPPTRGAGPSAQAAAPGAQHERPLACRPDRGGPRSGQPPQR